MWRYSLALLSLCGYAASVPRGVRGVSNGARCATSWDAPQLPAGLFVVGGCTDINYVAYPANASWNCAGAGAHQCNAQVPGFLACGAQDCFDMANGEPGPDNQCADTNSTSCVCLARKRCEGGQPPRTVFNAWCPLTSVDNCFDSCGVYIPCSVSNALQS